jgi:hypothetical protein
VKIMDSKNRQRSPVSFQAGFLAIDGIALAMVVLGWILIPTTSLLSIGAAVGIVGVYGLVGGVSARRLYRRNPLILQTASVFGLIAGLIFVSEILWEYLTLPADNTRLGLIEFGSVFLLFFISSLLVGHRTRKPGQAVLSAIGSAMIGSLIWLVAVLAVFYIFRGSPQQAQVFRAEGNYEDFARSGMNDFNAFIMEDFMGAGFFHLLLVPIAAAILGTLGGLVGKGLAKLHR